jgi:hypothetical protein
MRAAGTVIDRFRATALPPALAVFAVTAALPGLARSPAARGRRRRHAGGLAEQQAFGQVGLALTKRLFCAWHAFDEHYDRGRLAGEIAPIQTELRDLLEHAARTSERTRYHRRFANNLLKIRPVLWTFVTVPRTPWRRTKARVGEEPANGARRDPDAELVELARDPLVAPAGVLARHPEHEFARGGVDRRAPRPRTGVGPSPPDELSVPAQQRLRRDEQAVAARRRQQPGCAGKQRPVTRPVAPDARSDDAERPLDGAASAAQGP